MHFFKRSFLIFILLHPLISFSQISSPDVNPDLVEKEWQASWISHPTASMSDYGVFHFRNTFNLDSKPASFVIHVSADNRYRFFVNGEPIGSGPARGDLAHWHFESYDIADKLNIGKNVLAAVVWNGGIEKPLAQLSNQTALIVQGNSEKEAIVNTNSDLWKVIKNNAYKPIHITYEMVQGYYAAGATDNVDGNSYPWEWEKPSYNDRSWLKVKQLGKGEPANYRHGYGNSFGLVPRSIPFMEETIQSFAKIVRPLNSPDDFIKGKGEFTIPKKSKRTILIDQGILTIGYPELKVSGGKGSKIKITYSEALFDENNQKGHRDSVHQKQIKGYYDVFLPDGKKDRLFRPLWIRTFRYVQLEIETETQPLTLNQLYSVFTAYPFKEKAAFSSNDSSLRQIWDTGWRTARLCAVETYFDCPYYEQLQYVGDTRIQSLISLNVSGDDRLVRNSIKQFDQSRMPSGLTMSRFPSSSGQVIPPFSLIWVAMVHDYFMYRSDTTFVKQFLPGIENVLHWFETKIDKEKGMLGKLDWWNFVDWAQEYKRGVPNGAEDGNSALISLQYAYALDLATDLFYNFNKKAKAKEFADLSYAIKTSVNKYCFDDRRQLVADTPEKNMYSQHTNIMAILTDAIPEKKQGDVFQKVLADTNLIQSSIYFKFYLHRSMKKTGRGGLFLECLEPWKNMLNEGLTTFAETDKNARSDCHAWSASPNFDLLSIVCGIEPAAPGFKKVEISPYLGILKEVSGSMPHPLGNIEVSFQRKGRDGISGEILLPAGLSGRFIWNGKTLLLKSGSQKVEIEETGAKNLKMN